MDLKKRNFLAMITVAAAVPCVRYLKSASKPDSAPSPIVLTVMGRVADSSQPVEQSAFREFSSKTGVQIRFAQSLQTVNERIDLFLGLLKNRSPEPDLIDMDVIWPATLGTYLVDLTPYFETDLKDFAPELLRNFTVNGRLIAIPTFVDAGVLFYRADLLKKYGFRAPPRTWEELETMAARIQEGERRSGQADFWGYVWQGGSYESLTCNAIEWQSSSGGGQMLENDRTVRVRNPQFLRALRRAVSWVGTISPPGQPAFGEDDSVNFWLAGKAAFMRGWIGQYAGLVHSPRPVHEHVGISELPGGEGGRRGALGGSGIGISINSVHRQQALQLLKAVAGEATQRNLAIVGGYVPTRTALLQRPEVMAQTPLHGSVAGQVVNDVIARPALQAGGRYNLVSRAYYTAIHSILTRQVTPEEGLAQLETELISLTGFAPQ